MKKIKIYLVANEKELIQDEKQLSNFIRDLNDKYEEYDVYFKLITDEDTKEVNEKQIKDSELFFIMFSKNIDKNTVNKFDIAYENFKSNKFPKISTYIKSTNEEVGKTVTEFLEKLDQELGHYYSIYENIDTIKLNLILRLKSLGIGKIETKDSKLYLDRKELMTLENIPMIFNNQELTRLKKEAIKLENDYWDKKEELRTKPSDKQLLDEVDKLNNKLEEIKNSIYELEKNIIELQTSFVKLSSEENLSRRQIYAQKCLEQGDIEEAKKVLEFKTIKEEADKILKLQNISKEELKIKVNELIQRADILKLDEFNKNRFKEIESSYKEAIRIEKEGGLYRNTLLEYSDYLFDRKQYEKAIENAKKFVSYIESDEIDDKLEDVCDAHTILYKSSDMLENYDEESIYVEKLIKTLEQLQDYNELASFYYKVSTGLYDKTDNKDKQIEYLEKSIEIYENKLKSNIDSSMSYAALGLVYYKQNEYIVAEEKLDKALSLVRLELEKDKDDVDNIFWIYCVYSMMYSLYNVQKKYDKAIDYVIDSVKTLEDLMLKDPRTFLDKYNEAKEEMMECFANVFTSRFFNKSARKAYKKIKPYLKQAGKADKLIGKIYIDLEEIVDLENRKQYIEAEKRLKDILKDVQQLEKITKKHYEKINDIQKNNRIDVLSTTYNCAGNLYTEINKYELAEEYYKKSINTIQNTIKENNKYKEYYKDSLSDTYHSMAKLYQKIGKLDLAEEYYKKLIQIENSMDSPDDIIGSKTLCFRYRDLANFYRQIRKYEQAKEFYNLSIELAEKLNLEYPDKYSKDLSVMYNDIAICYEELNQLKEAEQSYLKSINSVENMINGDIEKAINLSMNTIYLNTYNLYKKLENSTEAEYFYKKYVEIEEKISNNDIDKIIENKLDIKYKTLAELNESLEDYDKVEKCYKKYVELREEIAKNNQETSLQNLVVAYNRLGLFYANRENIKEAKKYYEKAIEIEEPITQQSPEEYNEQLLYIYNNITSLNLTDKELTKYYNKKASLLDQITNSSDINKIIELDIESEYKNMADYNQKIKNYQDALEYNKKLLKIQQEISVKNPETYNYRLAITYNKLGQIYEQLNEDNLCEESYQKAIEIIKPMVEQYPDSYSDDLSTLYFNVAIINQETNNHGEAVENFEYCIKLMEPIKNKNEDQLRTLNRAYQSIVTSYEKLNNEKEAKKYRKKIKEEESHE